jgi:hypothetical protein
MKNLIILFFLAFFCYQVQAQILFNGSFEEIYPNTQIPKFWTLNHGESVVYTLDSTTFYSGKKSLKMESNFSANQLKEQAIMFPNGAGGLAYFNITHLLTQPFTENKVTVSVFVKAENITEGTAGILGWANIRNNLTRIFWFNLRKVQFFGNRVHLQKQQSVFYLKSYSQSTPLLN